MNEMQKAEALLKSHIKTSDIERATGINKNSLSQYRNWKTDLNKAKLTIIYKLANYYDQLRLDKINSEQQFFTFQSHLVQSLMRNADNDIDMRHAIEELTGIMIKNPTFMIDIYEKALQRDKEGN